MLGYVLFLLIFVNSESCGTGVPVIDYHGEHYCLDMFTPLVFPVRTQYCTAQYGDEKRCVDVEFNDVFQTPDLMTVKWIGHVFSRDILVATMAAIATTLTLIIAVTDFWQRCKRPRDSINIILA